jgi:hypothetical protein
MKTLEMIGEIAEAVLPLSMLGCGLILGIDLAEWLAARRNNKKESLKDSEQKDQGQ